MICRVNGVNFTGIYGSSSAPWPVIGPNYPPGHTWESYMYFPALHPCRPRRNNYLRKLSVSINFWRTRGGVLPDETIEKLKAMGIKIEVGERSSNTDKKPVRMEYLDDIDIPGFKDLPTFKRMCVCILKNDHACKYMGFSR